MFLDQVSEIITAPLGAGQANLAGNIIFAGKKDKSYEVYEGVTHIVSLLINLKTI